MSREIVECMTPADWERVRALRLRALSEAPDAFGTTLAEDKARPLRAWRAGLETDDATTFIATVQGRDAGLVRGASYDGRAGAAGLFSMWVAPAARGRGTGGALVDAVIAWARAAGYEQLLLDVGDENAAAIRLYASRGFVRTGRTGSLPPPREHVLEHERDLLL